MLSIASYMGKEELHSKCGEQGSGTIWLISRNEKRSYGTESASFKYKFLFSVCFCGFQYYLHGEKEIKLPCVVLSGRATGFTL